MPRSLTVKPLKFPDHAARGERCPWCQSLKRGRCSGCGQQYGEPDDTKGSTARRATRKAEAKLSSPSVPPVERAVPIQSNARGEASASEPPQPVVLVLPEPISANRWWRSNRGRVHRSHEAVEYMAMLRERARITATVFPDQWLSVVIVWRRARKSGDLDKRIGVLLDAMQEWVDRKKLAHPGIYADDGQIVQLWARRCDEHPQLEPGTVRVEVCVTTEPYPAEAASGVAE